MKDEPRSATRHHQLDHAIPTVIHHPEEDLPLLARWLHRAMQNPTRFWSLVGGLVAVVVGLSVLATGFSLGKAASDEAWVELETAKTPAERVEIASRFPKTPAGRWALLQAANEYYGQGFADLPANRDAALPNLKKALDLYEQVAREAPEDTPRPAPRRSAPRGRWRPATISTRRSRSTNGSSRPGRAPRKPRRRSAWPPSSGSPRPSSSTRSFTPTSRSKPPSRRAGRED